MELVQTLWRNLLVSLDLVLATAVFFLVLELGLGWAKERVQSVRALERLDLWLMAGALLGARIGAAVPEASVYLDSPLDLIRVNTGLSLYGAIVGGALALLLFGGRRQKQTLVDLTRLSSGPWPWAAPLLALVFASVGIVVLVLAWRLSSPGHRLDRAEARPRGG